MKPFSVKLFLHFLFNKVLHYNMLKNSNKCCILLGLDVQSLTKHRLPGSSRRGMLRTFINTFQYNTSRHTKAYDSAAVQSHHYCTDNLLQLKMQNSKHLAKSLMPYPSTTYLNIQTHLHIMQHNKIFLLKPGGIHWLPESCNMTALQPAAHTGTITPTLMV